MQIDADAVLKHCSSSPVAYGACRRKGISVSGHDALHMYYADYLLGDNGKAMISITFAYTPGGNNGLFHREILMINRMQVNCEDELSILEELRRNKRWSWIKSSESAGSLNALILHVIP